MIQMILIKKRGCL